MALCQGLGYAQTLNFSHLSLPKEPSCLMNARIFSLPPIVRLTSASFLLRRFQMRSLFKSSLLLLSAMPLSIAFAASVGTVPAQSGIELPRTMAWSAYPTGTGGYSQAVALGNILQRTYGVNLRVIPGRNDVSRLATLRAGRVHFSAGGSESVYAQEGILNFASKIWGPQPVRALLSNYSNSCSFTFATAADANILSVADMKGKRMTFVQGAPSLNNATAALLSYAELTWDDVERVEVGGYNASIEAILNNRADAAGGACNSPPFLRVEASPRGLRFPALPHDDADAVARVRARLPWYVPHIAFEGPTLPEEGLEVFTSAYPLLVGLESSDEAMAYSTVKIMHKHYIEYSDAAPGAMGWTFERQKLEQAFLPFHDGAIRYFKEAGVWTAAAEAKQMENLHRQKVLKKAWDAFLPTAPEEYKAFEAAWLVARLAALEAEGLITLADSL